MDILYQHIHLIFLSLIIEEKKATEARKVKEEQERQLALKLSKNFVVALEVYAKIEEQADKEGIRWQHLDGKFHYGFYKLGERKSYTVVKETLDGRPILGSRYCLECMNGEHPKMMELLTADEDKISVDMIKEAVLEDFREANRMLRINTKSYQYALRFIEIVRAFEK